MRYWILSGLRRDYSNVCICYTIWTRSDFSTDKDVHKQPALELVGWFTVAPESGPLAAHLPIHQQIMTFNESPVLLVFHASSLGSTSNTTGKLPLTLYESIEDLDQTSTIENAKGKDVNAMQVDTDETKPSSIKFRALPYSVETEETEMIGIDYVAKGGGNAGAIDTSLESSEASGRKGKRRSTRSSDSKGIGGSADVADVTFLSPEEDDLIATLTTRVNSVRMLQSRIAILQKFIQSLPPSYLTNSEVPLANGSPPAEALPHLRQINALITRLSLLTPAPLVTDDKVPTSQAEVNLTGQANDTGLTSLLALLSKNIQGANELERKFNATEQIRLSQRQSSKMMLSGRAGNRFDFLGDRSTVEPEFDLE